jgi:serine/threonine protein kinase
MNETDDRSYWVPEIIGNYKIIGRLGKGGMGDIYKAVQDTLNRTVALKILPPQMLQNDEFTERFIIEAKAISKLEHQNIVSIYEFGEESGLKYFAMQYIDGEDLGKKLLQKKPLTITEILNYSKQICRALHYAHAKNVIHRDIKPQNILIDKNNICRLSDFGIAMMYAERKITLTGIAVGTPEYMSPEQAEGDTLSHQTDIYSLGIVIYEMLAKRTPFKGNNPVAIAYKQVHELPLPPSVFRKDTPKRLELIILKALKKNRLERYKSIEEMLNDLDTVDIDEMVDKPTQSLAAQKKDTSSNLSVVNRRITDRRFGSRRKGGGPEAPSFFSLEYWIDVWYTQGISIILIGLLTVLFILHLYLHHY